MLKEKEQQQHQQQQKKKRDTRKGRRKKDTDNDGEEKELMERLRKLSVPASDEDEGKRSEGNGSLEFLSHKERSVSS